MTVCKIVKGNVGKYISGDFQVGLQTWLSQQQPAARCFILKSHIPVCMKQARHHPVTEKVRKAKVILVNLEPFKFCCNVCLKTFLAYFVTKTTCTTNALLMYKHVTWNFSSPGKLSPPQKTFRSQKERNKMLKSFLELCKGC